MVKFSFYIKRIKKKLGSMIQLLFFDVNGVGAAAPVKVRCNVVFTANVWEMSLGRS
jgi:hypothetical protein